MKQKKDIGIALLFLMPSILIFSIFVFYPLAFSFFLSITDWNLISKDKTIIGLLNYFRLLKDPLFWKVFSNTIIFSVVVVTFVVSLGLFFSLLLNKKIFGRAILRAGLFMPYVTATAAMSLVWLWIFDFKYGLMNMALGLFGINGPEWLASTTWALPAIIIMTIWRFVGYDMILYIGGLQSINGELIEAARIEGSSSWNTFWRITFPLLSPTTLFIVITTFITMLQNFETVYIMTQGGPVNSTNMLVLYLYQNAFQFFEIGYASTISVLLFLLMLSFTVFQLKISQKWIHY